MDKNDIVKAMRKFVLRVVLVCGALVIFINGSYILMTWLIQDVFQVRHVYLSSEFQFLGTLIIVLIILIILFMISYRRRKRELLTLSEHIEKVANGNFSERIIYNEKDSLSHVYRNFNKMSAELESVQFLRKDFINNFSHEFKTPIASINGFSSLLMEKNLPREEQLTYLEIIKDESDRLSRLTSNTILLSKLSSQEIISDIECYNLGEQIRQCSIILSHEWLDKNLVFSGNFPDISFHGNRELMQHLWLNLIGNAIKYTPNGGEISVELKKVGDHATVQITDTGQGMDSETLSHMFDPYYQGDTSHSNQGLGLGLSICRQIVDLCDGKIIVNSIINEGSTFIITLPL